MNVYPGRCGRVHGASWCARTYDKGQVRRGIGVKVSVLLGLLSLQPLSLQPLTKRIYDIATLVVATLD